MRNIPPPEVAAYTSFEQFDLERERIFSTCWLNVGCADDLPEPGDYVVRELPMVPASLIVMRGKDKTVKAFHNVCRHRGNRLLDGNGRAGRIVCDYHGWTYGTEGTLMVVPDEDQFIELEKAQCNLKAVNTNIWNGFVFVNLSAEPQQGLQDFLGEIYSEFHDFPFARTERVATYRAELQANWKTVMDIGRESYHIRFVHSGTVPDSHSSKDNPNSQKPYIKTFGAHARTSIQVNPDHKPTPAEAQVAKHAPTVLQNSKEFNERPTCVNPAGADNWAFDSNFIFPNFGLILGPDWFVMDLFWPIDHGRTIWEQSYHGPRPQTYGERLSQEYSAVLTRDLLREDWSQVEKMQKGMDFGPIDRLILSKQEVLVGHTHNAVNQHLNDSALRAAQG